MSSISTALIVLSAVGVLMAPLKVRGQWSYLPNILPASGYAALAYSDGVLWAGGDALASSTDNGLTWTRVHSFPRVAIDDISFCDKLHGAVATEGALYITTDGGTTWTAPFVGQANYRFSQVYISNSGRLIYALDFIGSELFTTKDAGVTWTSTKHGAIPGQTGHCFAIARDGSIYVFSAVGSGMAQRGWLNRSSDFGQTWSGRSTFVDGDSYSLSTDSCDALSLVLMNEDYAISSDGISEIFRTTDGGGTWTGDAASKKDRPYYAGGMSTTAHAIYVTTVDTSLHSPDRPNDVWRFDDSTNAWVDVGGPSAAPDARAVLAIDNNTVFVITSDGGIASTTNGGGHPLPQFPLLGRLTITVDDRSSTGHDTLFKADTLHCDPIVRAIAITHKTCVLQSVLGYSIRGTDSASFQAGSIVQASSSTDSLPVMLNGDKSNQQFGSLTAMLVLDLNVSRGSGFPSEITHDTIPLAGYRDSAIRLWLETADVHTDTIGGLTSVPIYISGLQAPQDVELVVHFDSTLKYEGSYADDGSSTLNATRLDEPNEIFADRAKIRIDQAPSGIHQRIGYAQFTLFGDEDDRSSSVSTDDRSSSSHTSPAVPTVWFDSLQIVGNTPCLYLPQTLATAASTSTLSGPAFCGSTILAGFVRDGKTPLFFVRPNPVTAAEIAISSTIELSDVAVEITDMLGNQCRASLIPHLSSFPTVLPAPPNPGIYYLTLRAATRTQRVPIVVIK